MSDTKRPPPPEESDRAATELALPAAQPEAAPPPEQGAADPGRKLTAEDLRTLAHQIGSDARKIQGASKRQLQVMGAAGAILIFGLYWSFHKVSSSADPARLAEAGGDAVTSQARDIATKLGEVAKGKAPENVGDAENDVLRAVAHFREEMEKAGKVSIPGQVRAALEGTDQAMAEEMLQVPGASALVVSAQTNPADADKLYEELKKRVGPNDKWLPVRIAPALAELEKTSAHMQKLSAGQGLNLTEQAERRVLQFVYRKDKPPPPAPAAVAPANLDLGTP